MSTGTKIALGGLAYLLYQAYTDISKIDYFFKGVTIKSIGSESIKLRMRLAIKNPTIVSVPLKSIKGKLYIDDTEVGNIDTTYKKGSIASKSTTIVPIDVNCEYSSTVSKVWDAIKANNWKSLSVKFDGYIGISSVSIPYSTEIGWEDAE